MGPELVGSPAMWANYGALGLVTLFTLTLLAIGARWLLAFVIRREERYAEETKRRDELFSSSLHDTMVRHEAVVKTVMDAHERTNAAFTNSLDRLTQEVRSGNGTSKG